MKQLSWLVVVMLALSPAARAGEPASRIPAPASRPADRPVPDRLSITEHELTLGGQVLRYRATAGYLTTRDDAGKEKAHFFHVAYEKLDEPDPSRRPITFLFNGGPGAASVWLHVGAVGPKRVAMKDDEGHPPVPPYRLVDNAFTWLDLTDLVFIDPVNTGYSRPAPGENPQQFFGLREDISAVADFIRLYITRQKRWLSPTFIAGESYGTTRAAGLSVYLADRHGIAPSGIILISTVLNFQTLNASDANETPFPLYIPSYTAIAHYHKKLDAELQKDLPAALKASEAFATAEYAPALARGSSLPAEQRKAVVAKLARFTGLPAAWLDRNDLKITTAEFRKQLLTEDRRIIGRYDARITGFDPRPNSPMSEYDPSLTGYMPAYSATFNDYVRRTLGYENDLPYDIFGNVGQWKMNESGYTNVADDLQRAMIHLPHLKVLVAAGWYDLATPYFAADYTVNHMTVGPDLRANITQAYYPGGHMMYHNLAALEQLKKDVRAFIGQPGK
ncbi:MAG: S10 family peptidase [Tepidisphaerales bacterium]